jgi:hypothetical protein
MGKLKKFVINKNEVSERKRKVSRCSGQIKQRVDESLVGCVRTADEGRCEKESAEEVHLCPFV